MADFSGLLILDCSRRDLAEKVRRAAECYRRKYGVSPDVCYVHPAELWGLDEVDGIAVESRRGVLRNHYWIGLVESR